jgi:hypothetical protein
LDSQNSTLTFAGPMVSVVNAGDTLQSVYSGPLFRLVGGSLTLTGSGALLTSTNSTVSVNGPLLTASGTAITANGATPVVSLSNSSLDSTSLISLMGGGQLNSSGAGLDATNSSVNLGTSSGNQVIINNAITPTTTINGIPVNTGTGMPGTASIGPNPIKNQGSSTVSITGSAIKVSNYGNVTITAP